MPATTRLLPADAILLKPGALTAGEYEEMKRHTVYGHEAIRPTGDFGHCPAEIQERRSLL